KVPQRFWTLFPPGGRMHVLALNPGSSTLKCRLFDLPAGAALLGGTADHVAGLFTCHPGSGASVCAVRDGRSVDTSMGLTPLEGLVMGTRAGDLDPGLLLYLLTAEGMSPAELDDLLNHQSGLRGLAGTGDVRELEQAAVGGDARAALALDLFAYRVRKYVGAYAAALEGLDAVAFTGGVGEQSATMGDKVCRGLAWLGVRLDPALNAAAEGGPRRVSAAGAPVEVWVVPTDEEEQIARETAALVRGG